MNFFQFLVVQNSKSETERYSTGSLHIQLEVWNTAIALFGVQDVHYWFAQISKSASDTRLKKMEPQNWLWWKKYLLSESPSWFKASIDIDLQFSFC